MTPSELIQIERLMEQAVDAVLSEYAAELESHGLRPVRNTIVNVPDELVVSVNLVSSQGVVIDWPLVPVIGGELVITVSEATAQLREHLEDHLRGRRLT